MKAHGNITLERSAPVRYVTFGALYLAQGIPQGLHLFAIPAWMALNGVDAGTVGAYVAICTLPWTFKLLAGPLMDRYGSLSMGRRRPWLLGAQLGLLVMMVVTAFVPDPLNNMTLFMTASFVLNIFGAVQDVATDGLAVDITPLDQQARANGVMWGAKVIGMGGTLVLGTWAINSFGFATAMIASAMVVLLILAWPSVVRERAGERLFPWSNGAASPAAVDMKAGTWGEILFTIRSAFLLRNSLIGALCILLVGTANGLKDSMLPLFTIQALGWDNGAYADMVAGANVMAAAAAMLLAGWLADRVGRVRIISIHAVLLASGWTAAGLMPVHWATPGFLPVFVHLIQLIETFMIVAIMATAMNLCWTRVAATQFTMYMVCNNMGYAAGAMLLGTLRDHLDWPGMFLLLAALFMIALLFLQLMRSRAHRGALERLDEELRERTVRKALEQGGIITDLGVPGSVV